MLIDAHDFCVSSLVFCSIEYLNAFLLVHEVMSLSAEVTATDEHKKRSRPNQDIDDMTPFYAGERRPESSRTSTPCSGQG